MEKKKLSPYFVAFMIIVGFILLLFILYQVWRNTASLYGKPDYSPNKRFRIEYYQALSFGRLPSASSKQGGDQADGFIRLYDSKDTLLGEVFVQHLRSYYDSGPRWFEHEVFFLGDEPSLYWELPK